jgi:hypothetical protein
VSKILRVLGVTAVTVLLCLAVVGCAPPSPPVTLTVSISSPADGATVSVSPTPVTGTVSIASATVTVNNVAATVTEAGHFSASVDLNGGVNTITVRAAAEGQEAVTKSITVTYIPISVEITQPTEGELLHTSPVTVTGKVSTDTGEIPSVLSVTVNGVDATVTADGTFLATIELSEGQNVIKAEASYPGGKAVTDSITVTYSLVTLEISEPTDGATVHNSPITVTGKVSPADVPVTVNEVSADVAADGTFHATITLTEGQNTIEARAGLIGGMPVTQTITVTYAP